MEEFTSKIEYHSTVLESIHETVSKMHTSSLKTERRMEKLESESLKTGKKVEDIMGRSRSYQIFFFVNHIWVLLHLREMG